MFRRRHLRALGKQLTVLTMSYGGARPQDCAAITRPIFRALAPYIADPVQLLFVRDTPSEPSSSRSEALVSVPSWPASRPELTFAIAHELHLLTRRQNGAEDTPLGAALVREGFATWFGILMSGWTPPWIEQDIPGAARHAAIAGWAKPCEPVEWLGSLGYALVTRALLGTFDLQRSMVEGATGEFRMTLDTVADRGE